MKPLRLILSGSLVLGLALGSFAQSASSSVERARVLQKAGHADQALQLYRDVLQQEPQNLEALADISGLLEAQGKWRDAVPYLEKLVELQPHDTDAMYRLGRMKSWESTEKNNEAATLLARACKDSDHNPEYCEAYANILSWKQETRAEAVTTLRDTLAAHPEAVAPRVTLGQILSWNSVTRPEALKMFDEGLQRDPKNVDLLLQSAEVLSWSHSTWPEAISRYDRVLQQNGNDTRALAGKAQLLVWTNHSAEGLTLYKQALVIDPRNPSALRGEAEILNRRGFFLEARQLAQQAHTGAPADDRTNLELARADIGLQRFTAARDALAAVSDSYLPDFEFARQEVHRGLGTYMEFGYGLRKAHQNADYNRFDVALSTPVAGSSRLTFLYEPTLYETQAQNFNSNYFQASLDTQVSDRVTTHIYGGAEVFNNVPVAADGGFNLHFKPRSSTTFKIGFSRDPIQESLLSTRGIDVGSQTFGQVRSNLADIGISYYNSAHKVDMSLDYTDGVYTGQNLDADRRYSVEAGIGRAIRSDKPYIRLGYGVNYTSFDHDADLQTGQPVSSLTGGYFSPTRYLLNQGVITFAHQFSRNVEWGANGTVGAQNVETSTSVFSNTQFASSFDTHLFWRFTPTNELRLSYQYLNVFNAFERNLYRFQWRHYF
ncbi:MAG: hypothetical protein DMG65_15030 [Candidatus Angelobacter sp. Gp1-AA117]|nr:MAG: hypothetical protein DMG65_15030 [Candidatus Angelobacter sp. Gp1-AA117]